SARSTPAVAPAVKVKVFPVSDPPAVPPVMVHFHEYPGVAGTLAVRRSRPVVTEYGALMTGAAAGGTTLETATASGAESPAALVATTVGTSSPGSAVGAVTLVPLVAGTVPLNAVHATVTPPRAGTGAVGGLLAV